jgi:uncharacterized membrane protein YedE/YeeE
VKAAIAAFFVGHVFGLGLLISGMANPAKVLAFLDLGGAWDPSLALVMAGAIAVGLLGFGLARKLQRSLLGEPMQMPTNTAIDRRLMFGAATFGIGWGLAGICPGPALVLVAMGQFKGVVFVLAMLAGMKLFDGFERRRR